MNLRSEPLSSQTLARKPGYFESRLSRTSWTVAASTSTVSAPAVNFRNGVGMTTLSDMICTPKYFLKSRELCFNDLRRRHVERLERFQTVARDRQNRDVVLFDAALQDQLLRYGNSHAASRFGEHAFGFGK